MSTRSLAAIACAVLGCGGAPRPATSRRLPTPTVAVGACGEPGRDGVVGASPRLERADRDLDGDGVVEPVVVDRAACTAEGNCYWNVFRAPRSTDVEAGGCVRYLGTIAGAALEVLPATADFGLPDVRALWRLGGDRLLVQEYRFVAGGYRAADAVPCRQMDDARLICAPAER